MNEGLYLCENNYTHVSKFLKLGVNILEVTQPAFTCSKLTIETPEQDVKCVQS